jgi:hypothetical protein
MKRVLLMVVLLLVAGCEGDDKALPNGGYAGSTADRQALEVVVNGGKVLINGLETRAERDNRFVQKKAPRLAVRCRPAPEHELVCELTRGGRTETVELMRL